MTFRRRFLSLASVTLFCLTGFPGALFSGALQPAAAQFAQPAEETITAPPRRTTCRTDEKGARVLADRGLGGTGIGAGSATTAPATSASTTRTPPPTQLADRGIGGTGISTHPIPASDRGMGGTGIVGVITGFGSVCLDGLEVAYNETAPVIVDGSSESPDVLRAGQLAVVKAQGPTDALRATDLAIRHEVSGPVSDVENGGRLLIVAGQTVTLSDQVWGDTAVDRGDWIEVSGLRTPNGDIAATRIDRRLPGRILVYGKLIASPSGPRIGALVIAFPSDMRPSIGQNILLSGRFADGVLYVDDVTPDRFVADPIAYFGQETHQFIVDSYVEESAGIVQFGSARIRPEAIRGFFNAPNNGRGVMMLRRQKDGSLMATAIRTAPVARPQTTSHSIDNTATTPTGLDTPFGQNPNSKTRMEPATVPGISRMGGLPETSLPFPLSAPNGFGGPPAGRVPSGRP